MKDAQKPDHVSLTTLVTRLKEGRFVIPDFQREFEWEPWDIRELMRSIFLDYYIGSLLLWKGKRENFDALACEPIYGMPGNGSAEHIVLDGQQRLTAMYYAFAAPNLPAPKRANRFLYFIRVDEFMSGAHDAAFHYDWTRWGEKILASRTDQFENHVFPLSIIGEGGWELGNWVQSYQQHWAERQDQALADSNELDAQTASRHVEDARLFGEHLKGIVDEYQVAYIELDRELEIDKVCDIFTQINSKGIRLDAFDLINALLKPKGLQLKHLWREAAPQLDFVESERLNVYLLQVMSILRQAYCSPKYLYYLLPGQAKTVREPDGSLRKEILVGDIDDFLTLWNQALDAMRRAIELIRHPHEFGAISSDYLPYVSILPAFASLQARARSAAPNHQLDAYRKIRHWYWASVFTNRYSGSVESTAARDYLDVQAWFENDDAAPPVIAEFQQRVRNLDLKREVRSGTSVYNGIFNLLVLRGARDWMSGNIPQYGELDDHHIVPKDWGKSQDGVGSAIDSILNRTPLTAETNRNVIRNRLPSAYVPELIGANGEAAIRSTLETHFISPQAFDVLLRDPLTPADFEEFTAERQRTIIQAIQDLLVKERLDLAPHLRELDQRVEQTEIDLRRLVVSRLDGDVTLVPSHIAERVRERLDGAARRSAAMDGERYATLDGWLEFTDLRELQDVITNRRLWSRFEPFFRNKEMLTTKFSQLAELRNSLRHTRTVDEITQKEGEAALLWFAQVAQRA